MANETSIIQKAAYLRGFADGIKLSEKSDDTSKLLLAMIDCIEDIAAQVSDNTDLICELDDEVDSHADSLDAFADLMFDVNDDEDDEDEDDEDFFACENDEDKCIGCPCPDDCADCCCDENCNNCDCDNEDDLYITCPYCDSPVPLSTLMEGDNPVCGTCHRPLCSAIDLGESSDL